MGTRMSKRVNRDDIDKFHDYSLYIPGRTIYMGSEHINDDDFSESGVEATMAERQIKNLHILDIASDEPITIIMNNPGGDVNHGLAIYDAIRACRSRIIIKVFGHAMSMGSIILQAADERIMSENSSQMIHYGAFAVDKHSKTGYKIVDEFKRIDKWMEKMYLDKIKEKQPHFTLARLQRMLDHDTFLSAKESVELGLADKILGEE
jgi:ATP-dependent Clp protease, protease subunit